VDRRGTQIDTYKSSGQITSRRVADDVMSKRVFEQREVGEITRCHTDIYVQQSAKIGPGAHTTQYMVSILLGPTQNIYTITTSTIYHVIFLLLFCQLLLIGIYTIIRVLQSRLTHTYDGSMGGQPVFHRDAAELAYTGT
jgi:hypothetical protein